MMNVSPNVGTSSSRRGIDHPRLVSAIMRTRTQLGNSSSPSSSTAGPRSFPSLSHPLPANSSLQQIHESGT